MAGSSPLLFTLSRNGPQGRGYSGYGFINSLEGKRKASDTFAKHSLWQRQFLLLYVSDSGRADWLGMKADRGNDCEEGGN